MLFFVSAKLSYLNSWVIEVEENRKLSVRPNTVSVYCLFIFYLNTFQGRAHVQNENNPGD